MCTKLDIPNEAVFVGIVRHHAVEPLRQLGVVEDDLFRVETIISEACTNVVRHSWKEGGHHYQIVLTYYADKMKIAVIDGGATFDVCRVPEPVPGQLGGYGVFLIRKMADRVKFTCIGGRTKLLAEVNLHYQSPSKSEYAEAVSADCPLPPP